MFGFDNDSGSRKGNRSGSSTRMKSGSRSGSGRHVPHHLSPEGLKAIQEAGHRRAGKPHPISEVGKQHIREAAMKRRGTHHDVSPEGLEHIREAARKRSEIYQSAKVKSSGMSSRASDQGMNKSRRQTQQQQQSFSGNGNNNVHSIAERLREAEQLATRLDEVMSGLAD